MSIAEKIKIQSKKGNKILTESIFGYYLEIEFKNVPIINQIEAIDSSIFSDKNEILGDIFELLKDESREIQEIKNCFLTARLLNSSSKTIEVHSFKVIGEKRALMMNCVRCQKQLYGITYPGTFNMLLLGIIRDEVGPLCFECAEIIPEDPNFKYRLMEQESAFWGDWKAHEAWLPLEKKMKCGFCYYYCSDSVRMKILRYWAGGEDGTCLIKGERVLYDSPSCSNFKMIDIADLMDLKWYEKIESWDKLEIASPPDYHFVENLRNDLLRDTMHPPDRLLLFGHSDIRLYPINLPMPLYEWVKGKLRNSKIADIYKESLNQLSIKERLKELGSQMALQFLMNLPVYAANLENIEGFISPSSKPLEKFSKYDMDRIAHMKVGCQNQECHRELTTQEKVQLFLEGVDVECSHCHSMLASAYYQALDKAMRKMVRQFSETY